MALVEGNGGVAPVEGDDEESNKGNMPGSHKNLSHPTIHQYQRIYRQEPDVTVVVGDGKREYQHYSQVLCLASDYFDAALNIGMKESSSKRIDLPDQDPNEWELFASFLEPFSQAKVTKENVVKLVPLFHKFGVVCMLHQCDRIYVDMVAPPFQQQKCWNHHGHLSTQHLNELRNKLCDLMNAYAFSTMYGLPITKERVTRALRRQISVAPHWFDLECTTMLVTVLQQEENRNNLWTVVAEYIPAEFKVEDPETLVSNKLFPYLLVTWMQQQHHDSPSAENGLFAA